MCIIDVFPCFRLSLCVVITWIVDVFPFLLVVVPCCIRKKRMCCFDIIIFFITIIFKWASSQNPFNTSFFYNVWFFVGSPYLFLCVILAMFFPLLLLVMCSFMHTNVFPLVLHHHCLLHVVVTWIVNVLVFEFNKLTPTPNTFFLLQCVIFLLPTVFLFGCIVVIAIFPIVIVCCIVAQGRKGGSNVHKFIFFINSFFNLQVNKFNKTPPPKVFFFFFGNVIFYS
jgi:hypothetical protein